MISLEDRELAISLIDEAVTSGAREFKACEVLGISHRTLFRWRSDLSPREDQRPLVKHQEPKNKLSQEERQEIINTLNSPEYKNMPPSQVVPALADEGVYIASESTMYRVLTEYKMNKHRGNTSKPNKKPISTHSADGINQVWMWDITYLGAGVKGLYFYLYLIIDLFSRKIVGWEVWEKESSEYASIVVRKAMMSEKRTHGKEPLVLHSDNGSPMKGASLMETLYQLGVVNSHSRPRVSNDNAYAESIFKTLKYRPRYPYKGFADIEAARIWVNKFVLWYNNHHHHSGLNFLTPNQRHSGMAQAVLTNRSAVYEAARAKHPERWTKTTREWSLGERVWLNPEKDKALVQSIKESIS
jgi:putative transposase